MNGNPWTKEQTATVRRLYANTPTGEVARLVERPVDSVYRHAYGLGLRKSAEYLASPEACRLRRGDNVGAASRFKSGLVPHNKGLRRPGYAPGKMASTQFKKGERSGIAAKNFKPIGTILTDHEGYLRIKVRDAVHGKEATGFGNTKVWPLLQRHKWEQERGPIPPSHTICFKDKDRSNCDIDNLELVSRADLARRNSMWGNMPREVAEVIQLNGALKRKIRGILEKQNVGSTQPPV